MLMSVKPMGRERPLRVGSGRSTTYSLHCNARFQFDLNADKRPELLVSAGPISPLDDAAADSAGGGGHAKNA